MSCRHLSYIVLVRHYQKWTFRKFEDRNDKNDKIIDSAVDDSSLFKHGSYEETAAKDNKNNFPSMYGAVAPLDMNEKLLDANQICNI
mmetsp:Transcript_48195/g.56339  ORF Transcript_48195/g.56339 Transcript_48195/m.56339 type:complete len:87 (+) Transcript_48195:597-857(+)